MASLLSMAGLYAMLPHAVAARTQEIGIRSALGATPASLIRLVLRQGGAAVAIGAACNRDLLRQALCLPIVG